MTNESGNIPPQEEASTQPINMLPRTYGQLLGGFNSAPERRSWPELVGLPAQEAEKKIKESMPGAKVIVVEPGSFITMDLRPGRVRIYVDSTGKVERPPTTG